MICFKARLRIRSAKATSDSRRTSRPAKRPRRAPGGVAVGRRVLAVHAQRHREAAPRLALLTSKPRGQASLKLGVSKLPSPAATIRAAACFACHSGASTSQIHVLRGHPTRRNQGSKLKSDGKNHCFATYELSAPSSSASRIRRCQ